VVTGEEFYSLCKHQKCEHKKGNKQSLQAYSRMSLYTEHVGLGCMIGTRGD
jgi:hypothetical protein